MNNTPKPCPFCGNKKLEVTDRSQFYELQGETGSASINIRCWECNTEMWEHSWSETNYEKRVSKLVKKWNRRHIPILHGDHGASTAEEARRKLGLDE